MFLHIAVGTALIPNTGISLPFFSSGGTSLLLLLSEMGVLLSISRAEMPGNSAWQSSTAPRQNGCCSAPATAAEPAR